MRLFLLVSILFVSFAIRGHAAPSVFDLAGNWEGTVQFGKFKFRMIVRIAKTDEGKIGVTIDIPDQGMKGMPATALLYNHPSVRLEIDAFGAAYTGALSSDGTEIAGGFDEGPGGKPVSLTFKRFVESAKVEPEKSYAFKPGEAPDIRGYWKGSIEVMAGMVLRIGLKIGRGPDGSFSATMDSFDQGAMDIPSTAVSFTNPAAKLEWQLFQLVFEATLSSEGKKLSGNWKQGGRSMPVSFDRLDKPAGVLASDLSFTPEKNNPDMRGEWKGTLEVQGNRLRLALKIGKAPDGSYAGTMASLDQGARDLPATSMTLAKSEVRLEWKAMGAVFEGTLSEDGSIMDGQWKQGPNPQPLKFERTASKP
jgi:hypothetical protein